MALTYQNPCEGRALAICWQRSGLLSTYRLQRSLGGPIGQDAETVYEGGALTFTDRLPAGAASVQYRLTDSAGREQTGALLPVLRSAPPQFLTQARPLGRRYQAFSVPFEAQDSFPGARLSLQVMLDGKRIESAENLPSPLSRMASVGEGEFSALKKEAAHTLAIRLQNEFSQSSTLSFSFTACSDPTAGCTFYLLRDGVAVAKQGGAAPFVDYGACGSHRYQVRIVDSQGGFCDSNEVTVESALPCAMVAPLAHPEQMIPLPRQKEAPPLRQGLFEQKGRICQFEGRDYAVLEEGGQHLQRFTARALMDAGAYRQLLALGEGGGPILYRDPYGNCMAAAIEALPAIFSEQGVQLELRLIRLDETGEVAYD